MTVQGSEKHAAQAHAERIGSIAPKPEEIRGSRVLKQFATAGRFYQAVFPSGNVYYVQAKGNGLFAVISQEVIADRGGLTPVGDVMDMFDHGGPRTGKLYKFTQKPIAAEHPKMTTYPEGTRSRNIGAKVGDKFIVVDNSGRADVLSVGEVVTLECDDHSSCPFFTTQDGNRHCIFFSRLAPLVPEPAKTEAEPVKPIPAGLQVGDRVKYDATKTPGGIKALHGVLGTVVERYTASAVKVKWDNGFVARGHGNSAECCIKQGAEPVSAAEAHDILAADETYALEADVPVQPAPSAVDACKQRIDTARANIARLESDLKVERKVLADAQQDLQNELKDYLPEQKDAATELADLLSCMHPFGRPVFPFGGL